MTPEELKEKMRALCNQYDDVSDEQLSHELQRLVDEFNNSPHEELNGFSPNQMFNMLLMPFQSDGLVQINPISLEELLEIPLMRQVNYLIDKLEEKEIKLTKNGWLPLKIVDEAYRLGMPDPYVILFNMKRINEYDVNSVGMARLLLDIMRWTKMRTGKLSLTANGRKALKDRREALLQILKCALTTPEVDYFDDHEDTINGNVFVSYSLWLLNRYGAEWHSGNFYFEHYEKVAQIGGKSDIYELRIFERLFYWLGFVKLKDDKHLRPRAFQEYQKTDLLDKVFSFADV